MAVVASHASHMHARVVIGSPDLKKKKVYIHLSKKIYIYAKLTNCDYFNKNVEHFDLRITKFWVR